MSRQHQGNLGDLNVHTLSFAADNKRTWSLLCCADAGEDLIRKCHSDLPMKCDTRSNKHKPPPGFKWVRERLLDYFKEADSMWLVVAVVKDGTFRSVMRLARMRNVAVRLQSLQELSSLVTNRLFHYDVKTKKAKDNRDVTVRILAAPNDTKSMAVYLSDEMLCDPRLDTQTKLTDNEAAFLKDAKRAVLMFGQLSQWYLRTRDASKPKNVPVDAMVEAYLKQGDGSIEAEHGDGWNHVLRCIVVVGNYECLPDAPCGENIVLAKQCDRLLRLTEIHSRVIFLDQETTVRVVQSGFISETRLKSSNNTDYRRTIHNQRLEPAEAYKVRMGTGAVGGELAKAMDEMLLPYTDLRIAEPLVRHQFYEEHIRSHIWRDAEQQMLDISQLMIGLRFYKQFDDPNVQPLRKACEVGLFSRYLLHGIVMERSFPYAMSINRNVRCVKRGWEGMSMITGNEPCASTPAKQTDKQCTNSAKRICPGLANVVRAGAQSVDLDWSL
jgi:hypothetical protein